MRRLFAILCAAAVYGSLSAQPGVFAVHPASGTDGKLLTMEEAVYKGVGYPRMKRFRWADGKAVEGVDTTKAAAYPVGRSLYYRDAGGVERCIAESESPAVTYGQPVSRNEFGIETGIFWSPEKHKVAFYRKDESAVTDFPLVDITTRTGTLVNIKYPMNGMASEKVAAGVYDIASGRTVYLDVNDFDAERYLTNVSWSPDEKYLFVQVLDRSQHHLRLNMYSAETGAFVRTLLTEDNEAWVEPLDPIHFMAGRSDLFIYRTDNRDGYRNLYLCDLSGGIRRLTEVDADVAYVGNDGKSVYCTSAEVSPVQNHLFRIDLKIPRDGQLRKTVIGKPVRLTAEEGWHRVQLSEDGTKFIDSYSSLNVPGAVAVKRTSDGAVVESLFTADDPLEGYASCEVDLGTVKSADGLYDNYYRLIKPLGFDPSKKYPVIVYVYGGPHSQMVQDSWLAGIRMWEMYMAERGYLLYIQDNRGTDNRGAEFAKAINRQCGQAEMADQMEGVKMLQSLPYVDASRIGVHGWSYGGYMTISLMTNYPGIFKAGVAGGPVIDWKWYEVMYGERYMDTPETNPEGFARTSLLHKAKDLRGKLLICQGAIDDTVLWQHSLNFVEECIKNDIQVDYFPYPVDKHNVRGRGRIHLMDKVTQYFDDYLL